MTETTQDFIIARMSVINAPANAMGNRLIATYDLQIAGVRILGCVLILRADGSLTTDGPRGKTHQGHKAEMTIRDKSLRKALIARASVLYEGFTGKSLAAE